VAWSPAPPEQLTADKAAFDQILAGARAGRKLPPGKGDDIAIIVLDTVRAGRLGLYGYAQRTSPNLDEWAKSARVYTRATADAPWTLPSHASMFTGQPSRTHGAMSVGLDDPRRAAPLRDSATTIAERLRDKGYETVGIAANLGFLSREYGLAQGFEAWACEDIPRGPNPLPYVSGDRVTAMATAYIEGKPADRPRLLFLNYMDAHAPWIARQGYTPNPKIIRKESLPFRKEWMSAVRSLLADGVLDPAVRASWSAAYDSELRFLDAQLAMLLPKLASFEHIFILSDHGEALGEHGIVEHGKDVWEELVHVPFIAKSPRHAAGRDTTLVQTHDLAWMVLEAAKLPVPSDIVRTRDLVVSEQYYTLKKELENKYFGQKFNRVVRSFRNGDLKIRVEGGKPTGTYNLAADPGEMNGAVATPAGLVGIEAKWLASTPAAPAEAATPPADENIEALRQLGYVE